MTVDQLCEELSSDRPPLVLDVREDHEVATGTVPGALHVPLGDLAQRAAEIPKDQRIAVICRSGNRSRVATDLLDRSGWDARNVKGGMQAWQRLQERAPEACR